MALSNGATKSCLIIVGDDLRCLSACHQSSVRLGVLFLAWLFRTLAISPFPHRIPKSQLTMVSRPGELERLGPEAWPLLFSHSV